MDRCGLLLTRGVRAGLVDCPKIFSRGGELLADPRRKSAESKFFDVICSTRNDKHRSRQLWDSQIFPTSSWDR